MSHNKKETHDRLSQIMAGAPQKTPQIPYGGDHKYVIISDIHLGNGGDADNFSHNTETLQTALGHYFENSYSLILLGDIEEFWQFDLEEIHSFYGDSIYTKFRQYHEKGKFFRVFGNHDHEWAGLNDPSANGGVDWDYKNAAEGLKIGDHILLTHGHQGTIESDKNSWFSRFWVRSFRSIEGIAKFFGYGKREATASYIPNDHEKTFYQWAKINKKILICGHTHRATYASLSYFDWLQEEQTRLQGEIQELNKAVPKDKKEIRKRCRRLHKIVAEVSEEKSRDRNFESLDAEGDATPCYFNSGCCLYDTGITAIEIDGNQIHLVKWENDNTLPLNQRRKLYWDEREEKNEQVRLVDHDLDKIIKQVTGIH
jgi:UDP-2,3-diacylglucosamine pyrophosphatase LpxH